MTSVSNRNARLAAAAEPSGQAEAIPTRTKIVATVGPACSTPESLERMVQAGARIFRLNFSHGDMERQAERVGAIRALEDRCGRPIAIMGDLPGPKIRVGRVEGDGVEVATGGTVVFQKAQVVTTAGPSPLRFCCTYDGLVDDVEPGQRLLVNDGAIRMLVVDKRRDEIECSVTCGGRISSGKGINVPESNLSVEALAPRDWSCVDWAIEHGLDCLAMSFVRGPDDIRRLDEGVSERLKAAGSPLTRLPLVAKIELPRAVANIETILEVADAIMVARGDLGVEMDLARVPVIQKRLLEAAQDYGRPAIVATQMLETMIHASIPTRAEASDVANAIIDEADAIMLSGETAVGRYPVIAVETMRRIADHTEAYLGEKPAPDRPPVRLVASQHWMAALAHGVWTVATDIRAKFVYVWTRRGHGARFLSQNTFHVPVIAVTPNRHIARQIQFFRGVFPVYMPDEPPNMGEMARRIDARLLEKGWARTGDSAVLVTEGHIGDDRTPSRLAIHAIGDA